MWDTDNMVACFVPTALFSMSSLSQNDQQNSFSNWSIALISTKTTAVFSCVREERGRSLAEFGLLSHFCHLSYNILFSFCCRRFFASFANQTFVSINYCCKHLLYAGKSAILVYKWEIDDIKDFFELNRKKYTHVTWLSSRLNAVRYNIFYFVLL